MQRKTHNQAIKFAPCGRRTLVPRAAYCGRFVSMSNTMKRKLIFSILLLFMAASVKATTYNIAPVYPEEAISECLEGWVLVEFSIAPDGVTYDHKVIDSYPRDVFESSALETAKELNYENFPQELGKHTEGVQFKFSFSFDKASDKFAHCQQT